MNPWIRWIKFNAGGFVGIGVQLAVLAALKDGLGIHYLMATALAVECAVLHNFVWHERWTWSDRRYGGSAAGRLRIPYLAANLIAIGSGALANFFLSQRLVFRAGTAG